MEAPLRNINCRNLTLESSDKLTNMTSRIQDTCILQYFCRRFKGQILPFISVILIRNGASLEPPFLSPTLGRIMEGNSAVLG